MQGHAVLEFFSSILLQNFYILLQQFYRKAHLTTVDSCCDFTAVGVGRAASTDKLRGSGHKM